MKNIGYVVNVPEIGGAERMVEILLRGIPRDEFGLYFTCPGAGPMADLVDSLNLPIEFQEQFQPSWRHFYQTYRHWQEWSHFITANRLSLIHANNLSGGRSAILAAYTKKIPMVCHIHSFYNEEYCQWVFRGLPKPEGFIFCSHDLRSEVGQFLKKACPHSHQWVIHNGIDTNLFTPSTTKNPLLRIGIIANLKPKKGHEDFLEMAALLKKRGVTAQYDIIGGDFLEQPNQKRLEEYAQKLGVEELVYFHGQVEHVENMVKQLDLVVCASHIEGLPLCVLEAMACAKPVVATKINGIPEAVKDGDTGILVPPHAPQALADAVEKLLNDVEIRRNMGENGRKRVKQFFSQESYIFAMLNVYREILR